MRERKTMREKREHQAAVKLAADFLRNLGALSAVEFLGIMGTMGIEVVDEGELDKELDKEKTKNTLPATLPLSRLSNGRLSTPNENTLRAVELDGTKENNETTQSDIILKPLNTLMDEALNLFLEKTTAQQKILNKFLVKIKQGK